MIFNEEQQNALTKIKAFLNSDDNFFLLAGYSGTGKTTLAKEIASDKETYFLAPTNAAVKRLQEKAKGPKYNFSTIHSYLFQPKEDEKGRVIFRGTSGIPSGLFIIDECSMIDKFILDYIIKNHSKKSKIIFLGDPFQLPPVGENPYLFRWEHAYPNFKAHNQCWLTKVERYDGEILRVATQIRTEQAIKFDYNKTEDLVIRSKFSNFIMECINNYESFVILCATNKQRLMYNKGIRKVKFKENAKLPVNVGETLLCISNNKHFVNGDIYYVGDYSMLGTFEFPLSGNKLQAYIIEHNGITTFLLPNLEAPSFSLKYFEKNIHYIPSNYVDLLVTFNKKFNCYVSNKNIVVATYGYATSTHKSQGNEWDYVFLDATQMFFKTENPKWFYTAITRAKKKVEIIMPTWFNLRK